MSLRGQTVLITGGTGSFGNMFVRTAIRSHEPAELIVYSRDELKQYEMRQRFPEQVFGNVRFVIGDVRDADRLRRAMDGVDLVVHAAALKQVPACEYNPLEAIKTNVLGAANVISAAIAAGVKKVIALSTDKAANPVNLYGATKLCADKLFAAANVGAPGVSGGTRFSIVRYGNVFASRGSVVPFFLEARQRGVVPITDPRMTRFWITLDQGVAFVLHSFDRMRGGEIFVPKIPSMKIVDLARALAPGCEHQVVGIRPGEKLHEVLVCEDDARQTVEFDDYYAILPSFDSCNSVATYGALNGGQPCPEGFHFSSDSNSMWLRVEDLQAMLGLRSDMANVV